MALKARRRRLSPKQKTSTLFHLWHNLQDISVAAEQMGDRELVLLVGMMELVLEERISGLTGTHPALLSVNTTHAH
jgi:hypothetical protein